MREKLNKAVKVCAFVAASLFTVCLTFLIYVATPAYAAYYGTRTAQVRSLATINADTATPFLLWYDGPSTATYANSITTKILTFVSPQTAGVTRLGNGQDTDIADGTFYLNSNAPAAPTFGASSTDLPATIVAADVDDGGAIDAGAHSWAYTQIIGGVETARCVASTARTATATSATVALTNITTGTGVTARRVYRTKLDTTEPYFLVS